MSMNFGCHLRFRCYKHMLSPEGGGLGLMPASGSMSDIADKNVGGYYPFC